MSLRAWLQLVLPVWESGHSVCQRDEGRAHTPPSHHCKCHLGLMITTYSTTVVKLHIPSALPMEVGRQHIKGAIVCTEGRSKSTYRCQVWSLRSHALEGEGLGHGVHMFSFYKTIYLPSQLTPGDCHPSWNLCHLIKHPIYLICHMEHQPDPTRKVLISSQSQFFPNQSRPPAPEKSGSPGSSFLTAASFLTAKLAGMGF